MTPEDQARELIDRQLSASGWVIQDFCEINISASLGVAVREFPLKTGEADYLLYVDGRAAGVVEAKPEGHTLKGVETQSGKYLDGLPANLPHFRLPLPFASAGSSTREGYAATGHGANRLLKQRRPENFSFSILQRMSPDALADTVIRREAS